MTKQFDVCRLSGNELVLIIQSDMVAASVKLCCFLAEKDEVRSKSTDLFPELLIGDDTYCMDTLDIAPIRISKLSNVVDNLEGQRYKIIGALDIVISGI